MMGQSTTNGNILELASVEQDIALALTKSPPSRDQHAIGFPPPKVQTSSPPMPPYVEHHADVDQIGKLSAEAVIAQYEGAVKALEDMGTTLIDCLKRAEKMAAGCKDAINYVHDTPQKSPEEATLLFPRIHHPSMLPAALRPSSAHIR